MAKDKAQYQQGEGRAHSSRESGSPLNPQSEGRVSGSKPNGSHLDQGEGGARRTRLGGSNTTPHPALTDQTSVRGGGTKRGHDRTNPTAGKSKSGSKFAQHPNNRRSK